MTTKLRDFNKNDLDNIYSWLTDSENSKWLDTFFQDVNLKIEQLMFFLMRKDKRVFIIEHDGVPVGIMGLTNIDEINKSSEIFGLLGNKEYRKKGVFTLAQYLAVKKAFHDLNFHSVNAWVVDGNYTIKICEKLNFKIIGRQRQCHMFDGVLKDRILFDILREDFDKVKL